MDAKMKVNVIGLGYIGLPTALMLAAHGVDIIGTDRNDALIDRLNKNKITFQEKGLEELFQNARKKGISFSNQYQRADIYVIAVPTPYIKKDKKVDASYIVSAFKEVLEKCGDVAIVVIESTISPGTIDKYIRPILNETVFSNNKTIHLVHAPERIIPGNMVQELMSNSRIIGADDKEIGEKIKFLYQKFCKGEIVVTNIRTAEMSKVVENTYRDVNIAFANELAKICRSDNLDVYEVIKIANMHPRVNILMPGPGVGGHCISVDPWFLVGDYPGLANIILAARKINDSMPEYVLCRIADIMSEKKIEDTSRIGFYGLTYKEDIDDIRESPTLQLLESMKKHLAPKPKVYDPYINENIVENQYQDFNTFLMDIDLLVIMVAHTHIKKNTDMLKNISILDTRNIDSLSGAYKL